MGIISIFSHLYPLLYATIGYRTCFFVFIPNLFSFVGYFPPTFFLIPASDLSLWVSCAHILSYTHIRSVVSGTTPTYHLPYPHLACLVGIVRLFSIPYPHLTRHLGYHTYSSIAIPRNQASSSNKSRLQTQI